MSPRVKATAEEWIRQYLVENPDASVDDVARAADAESLATNKATITRLRMERRIALTFEPPVIPSVVQPEFVLVSSARCARCGGPHWISQCDVIPEVATPVLMLEQEYEPEPEPESILPLPPEKETPVEAVAQAAVETEPSRDAVIAAGSRRTIEGTMIRRGRLNEIVEKDPSIHPLNAAVMLRNEFGLALDTTYIYETCRIARHLHGLEPIGERDESRGRAPAQPSEDLPPLTVDAELDWISERLAEVVRAHGLSGLDVKLVNGEVVWSCEQRVVRSGKRVV